MPEYKYLIVGGGMTADAAIDGIREVDQENSIGLFGIENETPYNRPPLSKALWKGENLDTIWRGQHKPGVNYHLGTEIKSLDLQKKQVFAGDGKTYTFDKLLLATGGTPRRFPFGGNDIIYYRTVADYRHLRDRATAGQRYGVIGGGFIGWEVAAALAMNGVQVVMIFPGESIGARVYPSDLSRFLNDYYREKGVEVRAEETLTGMEKNGDKFVLTTKNVKTGQAQTVEVDGVVAGLGIEPTTNLAQAAGLKVADGIVVNETLQTGHPDVYAAGDVAAFYNPALGQQIRVEHEDNANAMGRQAGRNMAGAAEPYHYLPSFYSDLFDLGYEAVGELDARLQTFADWKEPFQEGVVYYLRDNRVRGVLLWNTWGQVDNARALIAEPGPFQLSALKGRLPRD
jgi:NADPH-dependent 2,4-dienoyl-CoA reductase/sulfur reductase-like enzyme